MWFIVFVGRFHHELSIRRVFKIGPFQNPLIKGLLHGELAIFVIRKPFPVSLPVAVLPFQQKLLGVDVTWSSSPSIILPMGAHQYTVLVNVFQNQCPFCVIFTKRAIQLVIAVFGFNFYPVIRVIEYPRTFLYTIIEVSLLDQFVVFWVEELPQPIHLVVDHYSRSHNCRIPVVNIYRLLGSYLLEQKKAQSQGKSIFHLNISSYIGCYGNVGNWFPI